MNPDTDKPDALDQAIRKALRVEVPDAVQERLQPQFQAFRDTLDARDAQTPETHKGSNHGAG